MNGRIDVPINVQSAPVAKPRRRWLRFRLRTMLIAVAALCVWLAIVCQNAARQKHAVELIQAAGGSFAYLSGREDYPFNEHPEPPRGLGWLQNLVGIDFFETVGDVTVGGDDSATTHRAIDALGDLPHLRTLDIMNANLTDAEMAELEKLPLRQLYIQWCKITPAGWKSISRMATLRELFLNGENIDDAVLANTGPLGNITELELSDTSVTDAGLATLRSMPQLREIQLYGNKQITAAGIANVPQSKPSIHSAALRVPEITIFPSH